MGLVGGALGTLPSALVSGVEVDSADLNSNSVNEHLMQGHAMPAMTSAACNDDNTDWETKTLQPVVFPKQQAILQFSSTQRGLLEGQLFTVLC